MNFGDKLKLIKTILKILYQTSYIHDGFFDILIRENNEEVVCSVDKKSEGSKELSVKRMWP